jgi:hypothetical protein
MAEGGGGSVPDHDLRRRFEGQLSKFTNVVKGWQFRYTVSFRDPQWFQSVLRIRIRIHMFLGLLDPDLSIRGVDPDPAPDPDLDPITKQKK